MSFRPAVRRIALFYEKEYGSGGKALRIKHTFCSQMTVGLK
jgi:hypothetical protein